MPVLAREAPASQQQATRTQRLDYRLVGVALLALVVDDALSGKSGRLIGEGAVLVDGIGDRGIDAASFQLSRIRGPDVKIFAAVAWRGVHETGTGVVGDVIAGEERDREFISAAKAFQRVGARHRVERIGRDVADLLVGRNAW